MKQKVLFVVALAGLLLAFVVGRSYYVASQNEQAAAVASAAASSAAAASMPKLVRPHSPTLGPANAPVVIVEFFDPACETCAVFAPMVKELQAAHPDKIRLVLRYAPFHAGSETVVAALEASRRQERFWPTLEALFSSQAKWAPNHTSQMGLAWPHLEGVGLDFARMRTDMMDPEVTRVIMEDLEDARRLSVTMTPEFFVNGKPLPSFGYAELKALVDEALAQAR